MIIRIYRSSITASIRPDVARVIRVYNNRVPSGISADEFTQKGGLLAGTGAGTFAELPPGSSGQYLTPDSSTATGLKYETPSISISDPTNFLINGGFDFAQRLATPSTLTTISDNAYGADRWKMLRENADLQYQRNDAMGESGLTSQYYGTYKKITNAGKFMVFQIVEGVNSVPLRGKTVVFQVKMKASGAKTIRMAILELQNAGTIDTMPATPVSAWNVDSTDPTLGTNLAVITGAESKSVTTSWQNFSVSVTVPSNSKNLICAVWSDSDFAANDTLSLAEAGLFTGASLLSWTPRLTEMEEKLCHRFYYRITPAVAYAVFGVGTCSSTTVALLYIPFPVAMRIAPSALEQSGTAGNYNVTLGHTTATCSSVPEFGAGSKYGCTVRFNTAAVLTQGDGALGRADNNTSAYLGWSAEL